MNTNTTIRVVYPNETYIRVFSIDTAEDYQSYFETKARMYRGESEKFAALAAEQQEIADCIKDAISEQANMEYEA